MDQASRIIAQWSGVSDLISGERIACGAWQKAVGKRLGERTRAVKLVRDKLIVEVEDEVWRRNLWGLRFHILKNLVKAIGPGIVGDLEFRVVPVRREAQRETAAALFGSLPGEKPDESAAIGDPGMRRIYRNARRREIA